MTAIGGYFSLELPLREEYHTSAIKLNTGRNCLEYILRVRRYHKVYIPYYTCSSILEPFQKLNIEYSFYHIDSNLNIVGDIHLETDEALLYTNYFGLKQQYAVRLAERYGSQLIIDNTQAFYAKRISGIDTFYSCRKFFGVPDGAYLYIDQSLDIPLETDRSYDRISHLVKRIDLSPKEGFSDFHLNDEALSNQSIKRMSKLTERLMQSIDYEDIAQKRRKNFIQLYATLNALERLNLPLDEDAVPMVFPYMASIDGLRKKLIENRIYVARYWPNVLEWTAEDSIENKLTYYLSPLPIDQRYDYVDMRRIIKIINENERY